MSTGDAATHRTRRGQLLLFSGLAAGLLFVFAAWLAQSGGKPPAPAGGIEAELAGPGAEAGWVRRSEVRIGGIETRLREIEARNLRLEQENVRLQTQLRENAASARETIDRQAAVIDEFDRRDATGPAAVPGGGFFTPAGAARPAAAPDAAPGLPAPPMILEFELGETPAGEAPGAGEKARPLGAYVPAGSYAEAVVIAGADASVGVASQSDPRPVLLRLTGPAHTAAGDDGAAKTVDLAGCTVTAAAYGDLSSEKIYARLQTLTCTGDAPGTAIETQVAGFVAGAGKAGVRGPVVSREGALVEKAFLAGLVSGIGQGAGGALQPGAALTGPGLGDIGRAGIGQGAGAAGQKVSDYLIRRAEQYQPVIQLQAGTPVTVVFLEGAWLDGRKETNND